MVRVGRLLAAAALVIAAANHGRLASLGAGNVGRHELFVVLNGALAVLLVARPKWALYPSLVLAVQQSYSHGTDLIASVREASPFDWASLGVLVFFPALITLLAVERRRADTRERPPEAPPCS